MTPVPSTSTNSKWFKVGMEIVIIFFVMVAAWITLRGNVQENSGDIAKHEQRIKSVEDSQSEMKGDVRVILVEQKYILKGIEEIKDKLK